MKLYKNSIVFSVALSVVALIASLCLVGHESSLILYIQNICIGIFASGILLIGTSVISYVREKRTLFLEYHWKLSELKYYALELQTIPKDEDTCEKRFEKYKQINVLLKDYFAVIDADFFCKQNKKFQLLSEIQCKLRPLLRELDYAEVKYRGFICGKRNEKGERLYSAEQFLADTREVDNCINDFDNTGMYLSLWIEQKEKEFGEIVFNYNDKTEELTK